MLGENEIKTNSENKLKEESFQCHSNFKTEFRRNEPELFASAGKSLKHFCWTQDAAYWEEEVKDMIRSVERVQKTLPDSAEFEEVFKLHSNEFEDRKMIKTRDDLKLLMEDIEKMDAILKLKISEEKSAKFLRVQAEEESQNILATLPCPKTCGGMKINSEEFMKLLKEVEKIEHDSSFSNKTGQKDNGILEEEEKEKVTCQPQKRNNFKFVERNIQLAKCGHGTLSLTEEERSRIEILLADVEISSRRKIEELKKRRDSISKKKAANEKEMYGTDGLTISTLSRIDEQLERISEFRRAKECKNKISWFKKNEREKMAFEENDKGNERNHIKKINQLLDSINSISGEEIYPLSEEELGSLIQESRETLSRDGNQELTSDGVKCPHELIIELVSNAKLLMPKFKYRFDEFF